MTIKELQNNVLDLVKAVKNLGDKVTTMDSRIVEQNSIILKQSREISQLRSEIAGTLTNVASARKPSNSTNATATPPTSVTQRLIRQTRTNAAKAATEAAAAKKTKNRAATAEAANISEVSRPSFISPQPNATADPHDNESSPQGVAPLSATHSNLLPKPTNDDWQVVKRKQHMHKQRPILTGSGQSIDDLQTVEQLKYMQAWSFKPDTTVQSIMAHINNIHQCEYLVEKRDIKTTRHAAFVIGVPISAFEQIYTPSVWPPGVKISEWTYFRASPRGRGASAAETGRAGPNPDQTRPTTRGQ